MKKRLLFLGMAAGIISFNASAQLALETFDHAGAPPTGWTMINDANIVASTGTGAFTGISGLAASLTAPAGSAWVPINSMYTGFGSSTDYQMITTSDFSPAGTANRWLITPSFSIPVGNDSMVIQWQDNNLESNETIEVLLSPTAGTTAGSFTSVIYPSTIAGAGSLVTHQALIGTWAGTTVTVAFRDNTTNQWGLLLDNVQTTVLPHLDLGVTSVYLPPFAQTSTSYPITGVIHNYGVSTITSMHLNYSVNGGAPVITPLTGLSFALNTDYTYTSGTNWVPPAAGTYTIKVWADNLNGAGIDENHSNDTVTTTVLVVNTLQPKTVMIEEFNQASCDPCAEATPNVDSVYQNNIGTSIMLRYHVNFPGRDCMDSVTLAPFVSARLSYYGVDGVPDAQVDGQYVYPGAGSFTTPLVQEYASVGSPFTIVVTPAYDDKTNTFSYSAVITSFGTIPAGLTAFAALAVDTLTYANNQSTESIPQYVFPAVAENMFPSSSGTALGAFTTGSTQTITGTWTKSHPWASDAKVWAYDSTSTGKIIVWVEDATKYVYQAGYAAVSARYTVGVDAVTSNNGSMDVYPNPANKTATVALNLVTDNDVKLEVYNGVGQLVYSTPIEHRNSGTSLSAIDLSNFASGIYFVKVTVGDQMLNKTLTVTK